MRRILADPARSADERRSVAYALGRCGVAAEAGLPDLRAARKTDDPLLSVLANWAIARIRPADSAAVGDSLKELEMTLTSEDEFVRQAAKIAIDELRSPDKAVTKKQK
jgi:HEAT repeat protein